MNRVICIANQKGGVGKTTTAISLAAAVARSGLRTLLIDLDPQCNATSGVGQVPSSRHPLVTGEPIRTTLVSTPFPRLDLLPGCRSFSDVEAFADAAGDFSLRMTEQLKAESGHYDYIFIDSPPSLGTMTRIALGWSTDVLMPIQCEYFAMEGLVRMIEVIRDVMRQYKGRLSFAGIVLTMYDPKLELTLEVEKQVRDFFGEIVYKTVIPRDVTFSEASSHGMPIFDYAPRSRGTRAYTELCLEVLELT